MTESTAIGRRYWPRLDARFKEFLGKLAADQTTDSDGEPVYGASALPEWVNTVQREGWPLNDHIRNSQVFDEFVAPALNDRKRRVAFLMIDALRYE